MRSSAPGQPSSREPRTYPNHISTPHDFECSQLELRTQDVERLEARNRSLEAELVRLERELTNEAKDAIVARQKAAKRRDRN
jgi:hypothetical protein